MCVGLFLSLLFIFFFIFFCLFTLALVPFCLSKALYFGDCWLLTLPYKFQNQLVKLPPIPSLYTHKPVWILIGIILSLIILGRIDIFMLLSFLIHEYGVFLHLFVLTSFIKCLLCRGPPHLYQIYFQVLNFFVAVIKDVANIEKYMGNNGFIKILILDFLCTESYHVNNDGFCLFSNPYTLDISYALLNWQTLPG